MRGFDLKSGIIGALSVACVALALGAGQERATAPRYQISVGPTNSLFVLDNETGVVSSVVRSGTLTGQPWMIDYQFSLNDALSRRGGAPTFVGSGRMRSRVRPPRFSRPIIQAVVPKRQDKSARFDASAPFRP